MEISQGTAANPPNFCEWCMNIATSNCGNCHAAYYCSRDHQLAHWAIHKQTCKKMPQNFQQVAVVSPIINNSQRIENFTPQNSWSPGNLQMSRSETLNMPMEASSNFSSNASLLVPEKPIEYPPTVDEMFSSYEYSEFLSSENNFWNMFNAVETQNVPPSEEDPVEKKAKIAMISEDLQETASAFLNQSDNQPPPEDTTSLLQCASVPEICETIVRDLNSFGICVLDNFIGAQQGTLILDEVKNLYFKGIFKEGELVTPNMSREKIRSDVTTWVIGKEPECANIGWLMRLLDVVVTTCNLSKNNGVLSRYKLHRRTKAMIACYPGDGTNYKKHIDNPHKDGRCITCIYYLNKNWNAKEHGGLLRMFPVANDTHIANIEPIFDRMIFFWSDKRNPHEVLPSYKTRFAITVWYFDADERDRALRTFREQTRARQCRA